MHVFAESLRIGYEVASVITQNSTYDINVEREHGKLLDYTVCILSSHPTLLLKQNSFH